MIKFNQFGSALCLLAVLTFAFSSNSFAQKYKIAADTLKLNKEYTNVQVDLAKLNVKLIEAKNKTASFNSKSTAAMQDASASAQQSKTMANTATNGDLGDAKKSMKQAKKANSDAKGAKGAADDQADNIKDIKDLHDKIEAKQQKLADLDRQKKRITAPIVASASM